jgi:hypothetical protein
MAIAVRLLKTALLGFIHDPVVPNAIPVCPPHFDMFCEASVFYLKNIWGDFFSLNLKIESFESLWSASDKTKSTVVVERSAD